MPLKSHLLSGNEFSGCKGTAFFSFRQIFSPVFLKTSDPFRLSLIGEHAKTPAGTLVVSAGVSGS